MQAQPTLQIIHFQLQPENLKHGSDSSNPEYFRSGKDYYKFTRKVEPRNTLARPYYCDFYGYRVEKINCESTYEKDETKTYENVKSNNIDEYPQNGGKDKYWYELINN